MAKIAISLPFLSATTNKKQKLLNMDIVWFASKQSNGSRTIKWSKKFKYLEYYYYYSTLFFMCWKVTNTNMSVSAWSLISFADGK